MVKVIDTKTLKEIRNGAARRTADLWQKAENRAGRIEFRTPWVPNRRSAARPWLLGAAIFTAVIAMGGAILYFRKRKQISDRYTMGEGSPAEGAGVVGSATLAPADT